MTGNAIHILAIGQSNLANHCGTAGESLRGEAILDGEMYPLRDPIPGGSGNLGSVWPRFAECLHARFPDIWLRLTLTAQGGTSIEEWAPGGKCFAMLERRIAAGDAQGVSHVVFQQGEKDTLLQTTEAAYAARFRSLFEAVTERLGPLPWVICRTSYRFSTTSPRVIAAQNALVAALPGALAGPNLDLLGPEMRRDDTHLNDDGLDGFAEGLADAIAGTLHGKTDT